MPQLAQVAIANGMGGHLPTPLDGVAQAGPDDDYDLQESSWH